MIQRRIGEAEIAVGDALPSDVFDGRGRLLLRKGHIVQTSNQIEALTERGLVAETAPGHARRAPGPASTEVEQPSAAELVFDARSRLQELLARNPTAGTFVDRIHRIGGLLARGCELHQNAALATMLLAQEGRYSIRHAVDVALICYVLGSRMGVEESGLRNVVAAALTMNISMATLQDSLQVRKEPLTAAEREAIRRHPERSVEMLRALGVQEETWIAAVMDHHETIDGTGYPTRKAGAQITRLAQLVSLADVYGARVSGRIYRSALRSNAALRKLVLGKESVVDKELAVCLVRSLGVFPPGTAVRLENGEIAVVVGQGEKADTPQVQSVIGPRGMPLSVPIPRDTGRKLHEVREVVDRSLLGGVATLHALFGRAGSSR